MGSCPDGDPPRFHASSSARPYNLNKETKKCSRTFASPRTGLEPGSVPGMGEECRTHRDARSDQTAAVTTVVRNLEETMEGRIPRVLYWTPRVLCIVFAAFISIFAADAFREGGGFWHTALALVMHLIPTLIIVAVLAASWRREWIGGVLFIALALLYLAWAWNRPFARWWVLLIMAGPLVLTGTLFLLNWSHRKELRTST
jgi:hypothetical protein